MDTHLGFDVASDLKFLTYVKSIGRVSRTSPLDGVFAASFDDAKEDFLWNFGRYHNSWRRYFGFAQHREHHPAATFEQAYKLNSLNPVPRTKSVESDISP